jgi:hypothetical protein
MAKMMNMLIKDTLTNIRIKKGTSLASWKWITRPKLEGGLGVIKLRTHNDALLMKLLHKIYNKLNIFLMKHSGLNIFLMKHNRLNIPWLQLIWESY